MQGRSTRYLTLLLAILIGVGICSIETDAQRRRRRRVHRTPRPVVTNPVIAPPGSEGEGTEKIISTADENASPTEAAEEGTQPKKKVTKSNDVTMQQTIDSLSNQ